GEGDTRLTVVLGTKGGRPRDTIIQDTGAVKQALDKAIVVAERRNGRLIDAASLKQAMKYWRNQTLRMGLTGKYSPHSLRYAWAQDDIRRYLAQGVQRKRSAGDGGNGPRAWRRAWSLGEAGVCTE
ncbi:integrase domain-containing protein, partial [Staphylococcus sp. GCP4]|nr:integrase domain-containing protein [Staphylococcus sp. GCP4]